MGTSTSNDRTKFGTYNRDGFTGLDYADQRFYASSYGRFATADESGDNEDLGDPGSLNRYAFVEGDPITLNDPTGTDVQLPPIVSTNEPTCLGGFLNTFVGSQYQGPDRLNQFLNSDIGVLGLTTWLEWRATGSSQTDTDIWRGIAGTIVDRYNLPSYLKVDYGISQGSLTQVAQQASQVWKSGILPTSITNSLISIFDGPPPSDSPRSSGAGANCNGLTAAFHAAIDVNKNPSLNPFAGSLFFASGNSTPSTFFEKELVGSTVAEGASWRFWKIVNPPDPPRPPRNPAPRRPGK